MGLRACFIVGFALLGVLGAGGGATACVAALPMPGESQEAMDARLAAQMAAYELERQRGLWSSADRVFTARVSIPVIPDPPPLRRYDPRRDGPPRPPKPVPLPRLDFESGRTTWLIEPLADLKATRPPRPFEVVQWMSLTSCGPTFFFNDTGLDFSQSMLMENDVVVVFLKGPYPTQAGVLATLKPEQAVDPDLKAALALAGAGR
jgi:hypothetical protein